MAGLPKSCPIRVAKDASKSIPAFAWKPCPSGREGCRSFLADWSPSKGGPPMIYYSTEPVFEVAGVPVVAYGRWGYGKDSRAKESLRANARDDGGHVFR